MAADCVRHRRHRHRRHVQSVRQRRHDHARRRDPQRDRVADRNPAHLDRRLGAAPPNEPAGSQSDSRVSPPGPRRVCRPLDSPGRHVAPGHAGRDRACHGDVDHRWYAAGAVSSRSALPDRVAPPSSNHRRPDGFGQPQTALQSPGRVLCRQRRSRHRRTPPVAAVRGPRPLQGDQRFIRTLRRRRGPQAVGSTPHATPARHRCPRAGGR